MGYCCFKLKTPDYIRVSLLVLPKSLDPRKRCDSLRERSRLKVVGVSQVFSLLINSHKTLTGVKASAPNTPKTPHRKRKKLNIQLLGHTQGHSQALSADPERAPLTPKTARCLSGPRARLSDWPADS